MVRGKTTESRPLSRPNPDTNHNSNRVFLGGRDLQAAVHTYAYRANFKVLFLKASSDVL
jgi:hypothetical protein